MENTYTIFLLYSFIVLIFAILLYIIVTLPRIYVRVCMRTCVRAYERACVRVCEGISIKYFRDKDVIAKEQPEKDRVRPFGNEKFRLHHKTRLSFVKKHGTLHSIYTLQFLTHRQKFYHLSTILPVNVAR